MGILDFLFGEGPSVDTQVLDTLTPEQRQALNDLLRRLSEDSPTFQGETSVEASDLSQLSLSALEDRARALGDPNREGALSAQASDTLFKLLNFEASDAGIEDFFRTNIRDPALEEFQRNILPAISRDFGGANFFSSERQGADARAQKQLIQSLTQARSGLAFNAKASDRNRALQALGLAPGIASMDSNELLRLLQGGDSATALSERNVGRDFDRFLADSGIDQNRINSLLGALNTQSFENVVTTNQGTAGLIPQLLSAVAGGGITIGGSETKITDKKPPPATGIAPPSLLGTRIGVPG